ncbi:SDR family oxidoreductase [uncultured Sneathiella sp.]|uniref:SDR family NAD(P)-dependent oxidoreductase n=1 Tax=uncultured Sneathiella sp. TaxID=879315 RepID=UPI0030EF540C
MEIKGAIALVTGGANGLGHAIATFLGEQGAQVVVADLDKDALAGLPEEFDCHLLDVTRLDNITKVVSDIVQKHGRIDILVNNAGVIFNEPLVNIMNPNGMIHDYDRFRKSIVVNLDSVFLMTGAVVEHMIKGRVKGCIVNISSISAHGNEGQTAYSAAKSGVNAMTVTWSKELGRMGIRCNAIAPGFIDTGSTNSALNETTINHIVANTPVRRLGDAKEVAAAVASVISNDFINGVVLEVNGGITI